MLSYTHTNMLKIIRSLTHYRYTEISQIINIQIVPIKRSDLKSYFAESELAKSLSCYTKFFIKLDLC